jgi:hypothetical protein
MGAKSLASIGWKSLRVRIAMADGAWAYVEEAAKGAGIPVRDMLPALIGRGIEHSFEPDGAEWLDRVPAVGPDPVVGPDGQLYRQTSLEDLGLPGLVEG